MACYNGAQEFIKNVGIPEANVHKTMDGSYEKVAEDYAAKISELVPKNKHGVPSFDLVLLGTGDDGHVGSLYPNTPELINGYGTGKLVMPINSGGKGTVAISMDLMNAADAVVLSAVGAIRKKPAVLETEYGDVIAIRHMMYLSHSYDHRVVDGALGGMFVRRVADYLEQWDVNREI
jgi:6-phosphogluconolactonase/glucosamine-6-phosphate isomerase/deaminase